MALLSDQDRKARDLAKAINDQPGTWTVSAPGERRIRFHILDHSRKEVLQRLEEWGWKPKFKGTTWQFALDGSSKLVNVYEITVEGEPPVVHDDRTIRGEIASPKKA